MIHKSWMAYPALQIQEGMEMEKRGMKIMGILNVTPDSFYDGGRFNVQELAIEKAFRLQEEGADILDIGGESTRPGARDVPVNEEIERVVPVISALKGKLPIPISIDTMKPEVAMAALKAGASMINDVSGFRDPRMVGLAREAQVPICVMHMLGTPKTMQSNPVYREGVVPHLLNWFQSRADRLLKEGIREENIILDPGIGFGKTVDDNLKILHNLQRFKAMGFQLLVGLSRKSFMSRILDKPASETLAATLAMNTLALLAQADIIRVHDVREHRDAAKVVGRYFEVNQSVR